MFDEKGNLVWATEHHVWGDARSTRAYGTLVAKPSHEPMPTEPLCPWRFPGQYEDAETGLYYNRHRHHDPLTAQYVSPDPIGLAGGDRPQGYVLNPNLWTDPLGLQARGRDGKFLPRNGLPGPGSTFQRRVTETLRSRGYTVHENVTIRIGGKVVSFGDQIAVKGNRIYVIESKGGRTTLSKGQAQVRKAIQSGQEIEFTGPNAPNIPGVVTPGTKITLPRDSWLRATPESIGSIQ
ncbi:RHS repeat-associated core domain-containing protein [Mesorhizobium retamae]|uniref:RHS repeat-associated core domain-containing protein n=1 Tax=Mesorhizobium retamae TaxID=2912854 RepID=UPI003CCFF437